MIIPKSPYPKLHSFFDNDSGSPRVFSFCRDSFWDLVKMDDSSEHADMDVVRREFDGALSSAALSLVRHVKAAPVESEGSVPWPDGDPDPKIEGLDYWVAPGSPLMDFAYIASFRHACYGVAGSVAAPGWGDENLPEDQTCQNFKDQAINVNVLKAGSAGYEWHFDPTPVTAVYYPLSCPTSEFKFMDKSGKIHRIACGGDDGAAFIVGDLSQIPHAVGPVKADVNRVSVPMAMWPVRSDDLSKNSDFLYGGTS
jgi:hypothetical protein